MGPLKKSRIMKKHVSELSDDCHDKDGSNSANSKQREALIMELKHLNDEVSNKQKDTDLIGNHEQFKGQYSILLSLLSDARSQVKSGLHYLSQRNIYLEHVGNFSPIWFRSRGISKHVGLLNCSSTYDLDQHSSSYVTTMFESSRQEARAIFDETMQTIISLRGKEASVAKFREIIGSVKYSSSIANPSTSENIKASHHHQVPSSMVRSNASNEKVQMPDAVDAQIPSELISACVATFLMIQTCAEGRDPPAEVGELLERAVASLQPCCSENLPLYNDIETCMGFIKTQMLARVPTPTTITPCK